jgi:hypothetical protein
MLYVLAIVFGLIAAALTLTIVVGAFRQSAGQGLLCLFVPFYALIFAFTKWTYDKRVAVGVGYLVAAVGAPIFMFMAIKATATSAVAALKEIATSAPTLSPPATTANAAAAKLPIVGTCTISYGSRGLAACKELHGSSVPSTAADKCKADEGTFAAGTAPCPAAGATGKCDRGAEIEFSYAGAVGDPKGSCEILGYTWTAMAPAAAAPAATNAPARPAATPAKAPRRK